MDATQIGVVFDCDGTLVDSMDAWRGLEATLAARAGVHLTPEDKDVLTACTLPECGVFFHNRFGLGSSPEDVVRMMDDIMMDYYQNQSEPRPGALAFVQGLAERGVHMALASSSSKPFLLAAMDRCGFAPYLDAILSVDDVHSSKREPDVWHRARQLMGTPLATTWGVEDAAYALATLRGAGYRTLGIHDCDVAGTWDQLRQGADHAIKTFEDIDADTFIGWNE